MGIHAVPLRQVTGGGVTSMTSDRSWNTRNLDPRIRNMAQEAARRAGMSLEAWIRAAVEQHAVGAGRTAGAEDAGEADELLARLGDKVRAMTPPQRERSPAHRAELDEIIRRIARDLQDADETARSAIEGPQPDELPEEGESFAETLRNIEAQVSALADRADAGPDDADPADGAPAELPRDPEPPPPRASERHRPVRDPGPQIGRGPRLRSRPAPEARRADPPRRRPAEADPLSVAIADISSRQNFLAGRPAAEDTTPAALAALRVDIGTLAERIATLTEQSIAGRAGYDATRLRVEKAALSGQASMAAIAATLGDIRTVLDDLAVPRRPAAEVDDIAGLVVGFAELRAKVDGLEKTGRQGGEALRRLEARVETIARADPAALVRGVEARIDRLAAQVDAVIRAPSRTNALEEIRAEIAAVRLEVATRGNRSMEAMERRIRELIEQIGATARSDDSGQLAALETRVEGLVADLAGATPRADALEQVEQHIDRLRQSLAEGREEAVEAARAAAQAAVRDLEASGATRGLVEELRKDLDEVRGLIARADRPAAADDAAIEEKLAEVADRIESLAEAGDLAPVGEDDEPPPAPEPRRDLGLVREVVATVPAEDRPAPDRRADFIAAARRAVQTAMEQAAGASLPDDDAPAMLAAAGGPSPFARIGQAIRSRRRPLLLAAAALVLAIGALQMFGRPMADEGEQAARAIVVERPFGAETSAAPAEDTLPIPAADSARAEPRAVGPVDPYTTASTGPVPGVGPEELRAAAAAGDPLAAYEVANLYADGRGTLRDLGQAAIWYQRAADAGMVPAIFRLASLYERGQGVPADVPKAMALYQRAAEQGNPGAMYNLAVLLNAGAAGAPDPGAALAWFRAAAEHGVKDSQYNLGVIYSRGIGVPVDRQEAYTWFAIAADAGDPAAVVQRDQAARALNANQLSVARAAATAFRPRTPPPGAVDAIAPVPTTATAAPAAVAPPVAAAAPARALPQGATAVESRQALVRTVQTLLAERGYDPGPVDGLEGPKTIQAVRAFQRSIGVASTGQIDGTLVTRLSQRIG